MSLLTGPSAAALYGYEGANGVVLITTKKGRADKTTVTYSNNTTFSDPMMMPKFQNTYGNMTGEMMSWGLETDKRYDPANFLIQEAMYPMHFLSLQVMIRVKAIFCSHN